jgi:hypothetical protein
MKDKYEYYTMTQDGDYWNVYGWSVYDKNSVLAGQPRKVFLESYETSEEVERNYPGVTPSNRWTEPEVSVGHAPANYYASDGGFYDAGEYWSEEDY